MNRLRIRGQNRNNARKSCHDSKDLMETVKKSNKIDGMNQGLMDTKETQQDLKVFTDYDEKQRENTNWTQNDKKPATRT